MTETLKKETKTESKPAKKYLIEMKKGYRPVDPKKVKILENGEERALTGADDRWEDGVHVYVAQGEHAKITPGKVMVTTDGKLAKWLVQKRIGILTEDWD